MVISSPARIAKWNYKTSFFLENWLTTKQNNGIVGKMVKQSMMSASCSHNNKIENMKNVEILKGETKSPKW